MEDSVCLYRWQGKDLGLEPKGIPPRVAEEAAQGSSSITSWEFSILLPTRRRS